MNRELQGQLYNPNKWARDRSWSTGRPRLEAGKATQITVRPQITTLRTEVREQHTQEITDLLTCLLNMIENKIRTTQCILALMAIEWSSPEPRDHVNYRLNEEALS